MQTVIEEAESVWAYMQNERQQADQTVVFGMMNGTSKKVGADDVKDWCNKDIQTLSQMAQDRTKWRETVNHACDTNGH